MKKPVEPETVLIKDPDLPWPGDFPYERLDQKLRAAGSAGLDAASTDRRVKDALFDLMMTGPVSAEDRLAWDELRLIERRLLVDFLMYAFQHSESEVWSDDVWDLPMPFHLPDFSLMADDEPPYDKIVPVPSSLNVPAPPTTPIAAGVQVPLSVDIGPVDINEVGILGDAYVEE